VSINVTEDEICALEVAWASGRKKGMQVALIATFGGGWLSIGKEASKQTLKYVSRKVIGCLTVVVCGYFGSASIILVTKSVKVIKFAKVCHSACSGSLAVAELCASAPINILEIGILVRPVAIEGEEFDLFSKNPDLIKDLEKLFNTYYPNILKPIL